MSLPADWSTVRVTARYLLRDGGVPSGSVTFSSPQIVLADGAIVMPVDIVATLDETGAIDIQLPATNDPDVSPQGWAYTVQERIDGCAGRRFAMAVDAGGGDIDLATVAPVVAPAVMGALSAYNLAPGNIEMLPAGSAPTMAIRGAIPNQVLDLGIPSAGGSSDPLSGITQAQADARYVQKTQVNAASGVAGLDANSFMTESQLPLPPVTLTVLLANKLA
jgi:hypothetical protein